MWPVDELRHLDWKAYSRTDRYYIKLYEQETNLRTTIVLDCSALHDVRQQARLRQAYVPPAWPTCFRPSRIWPGLWRLMTRFESSYRRVHLLPISIFCSDGSNRSNREKRRSLLRICTHWPSGYRREVLSFSS